MPSRSIASQPSRDRPEIRTVTLPAAYTRPLQKGRAQRNMDRLPQSRPPALMSEVTAPLSPYTLSIISTVPGGRRAEPQKVVGA